MNVKRCFFLLQVLLVVTGAVYAQNTASPVPQMDDAVREIAGEIHKKLVGESPRNEERVQKAAVGQFTHRGYVPAFGTYWTNQLIEELVNIPERPYIILSGGTGGADWIVSGEIVEIAGVIRVYTRLIRTETRAVEGAFHTDFEKTAALTATLFSSESRGGSGSSSGSRDEYEPDSWDNPVSYEIGNNENAPVINRSLHGNNDEDFFLIIPERDGRLTVETTGGTDTVMQLYNYEDGTELAENDDGGQGSNARIRHNVRAGTRYLVKVRGYGNSTTGNYGFRAYLPAPSEGSSSWENPIPCEIGTGENSAVINRTLDTGGEDYFLIIPNRDGRHTVETTGGTDTFMHIYDHDTRELLTEDDDGGTRLNARIRINLQAGKRYIVVISGYDSESGSYGFRVFSSGGGSLPRDEDENDSSRTTGV